MYETPVLVTPRLHLSVAGSEDAPAMLAFHAENEAHLRPWAARRPEDFGTLDYWTGRLALQHREARQGRSLCLAMRRAPGGPILGEVNFRNIIRGAFQACHLGYHLGADHVGQGLMHEALTHAIAYAFDAIGLHRVQANYIPHNTRSANVLARLGFVVEGYARDYLKINGQWEDHVLTSLLSENFTRPDANAARVVGLSMARRPWLARLLEEAHVAGPERDPTLLPGFVAERLTDAVPLGALVLEERDDVIEVVALVCEPSAPGARALLLEALQADWTRPLRAHAPNDDLELQALLVRHGFRLREVRHDAIPERPGVSGVLRRDEFVFERRPL